MNEWESEIIITKWDEIIHFFEGRGWYLLKQKLKKLFNGA